MPSRVGHVKKPYFLEENRFAKRNIAYFSGFKTPSAICQLNPRVKTLRSWAALGPVSRALQDMPLKKPYFLEKNRFAKPKHAYFSGFKPPWGDFQLNPLIKTLFFQPKTGLLSRTPREGIQTYIYIYILFVCWPLWYQENGFFNMKNNFPGLRKTSTNKSKRQGVARSCKSTPTY